jgi:hypothetical protein
MPDYEVTSPSGQKFVVTAPDGASQEQVMTYAKQQFAEQEKAQYGIREKEPNTFGQATKNVAQGAAQFATGVTGGLAGDIAGLGAQAYDITANAVLHPFSGATPGGYADPAKVRENVSRYFTYRAPNQDTVTNKVLGSPAYALGGVGEVLAKPVDDIPYAGNLARALPIAAANYFGAKAAMPATFAAETPALIKGRAATENVKVPVPDKFVPAPIKGATPEERAQAYVERRTNFDWAEVPASLRQKLTDIAKNAGQLEGLDATAVERAALLESLDLPIKNATRGQITRDPLQQRNEQLLKATEGGRPLRETDIAQNKALLDNLDILRGKTGSKSSGEMETGRSVQSALRAREAREKIGVTNLYKEAEKAGELQGKVNIDPLVKYLKTHDDPSQVGYAMSRLKQLGAIKEETNGGINVSSNRFMSLAELEGIRRAANAAGKNGGTAGHYASELKGVIDDITDGAGGEKYKQARAARKAVGDEFERQQAVARLVKNRKMSSDRAVALEDTWHKTVLAGSLEDLQKVRKSLDASPNGKTAWSDLQATTIDYIKNRATGGKLGLRNETGELNSTWAGLKRAVDEIGQDKLNEIFGDRGAKRINAIVDSAQILKTEAPTGVKGSPTIDKFLTLLDKVPVLGSTATAAVKLGQKVKAIGQEGRDLRRAQSSPLDDK